MIYHLLYISEKNMNVYEENRVDALLQKSQQNNEKVGVTGILIDNGRFFIQLLEGKESDVRAVYERISRDKRHLLATILLTFTDNARLFPGWSMGLIKGDLDTSGGVKELITELEKDLTIIQTGKTRIVSLLKKFNTVKVA